MSSSEPNAFDASADPSVVAELQLRQDVESGRVTWRAALRILTNPERKPWSTAAWKRRRAQLIATACTQCGSTTPPLVLQHVWQPPPVKQVFQALREERDADWLAWQQLNPPPHEPPGLEPDTNACPRCGSTNIVHRKRANIWVCQGVRDYVRCGSTFPVPSRAVSKTTLQEASRKAFLEYRDRFDDESGIGKQAVLRCIGHHLRYMSLKDTTTLCKRCAHRADVRGQVLCRRCGKHYHSPEYPICYTCSGGLSHLPTPPATPSGSLVAALRRAMSSAADEGRGKGGPS